MGHGVAVVVVATPDAVDAGWVVVVAGRVVVVRTVVGSVVRTVVTGTVGVGSGLSPALLRTASTSVTAPVMIAAMPNQNRIEPKPKRRRGAVVPDCVIGISCVICSRRLAVSGAGAVVEAAVSSCDCEGTSASTSMRPPLVG